MEQIWLVESSWLVHTGVLLCCFTPQYHQRQQERSFHPDDANKMTVLAEIDLTQYTNNSKQTCLLNIKLCDPTRPNLEALQPQQN